MKRIRYGRPSFVQYTTQLDRSEEVSRGDTGRKRLLGSAHTKVMSDILYCQLEPVTAQEGLSSGDTFGSEAQILLDAVEIVYGSDVPRYFGNLLSSCQSFSGN